MFSHNWGSNRMCSFLYAVLCECLIENPTEEEEKMCLHGLCFSPCFLWSSVSSPVFSWCIHKFTFFKKWRTALSHSSCGPSPRLYCMWFWLFYMHQNLHFQTWAVLFFCLSFVLSLFIVSYFNMFLLQCPFLSLCPLPPNSLAASPLTTKSHNLTFWK